MTDTTLNLVIILLGFAVIAISALRRVDMPPVLAYLFTGMLVGPHGLGWITNPEETRTLADYGVVFLLFTLGLEFSAARLIAMRRDLIGLGGAQMLVTGAAAGAGGWLLGLSPAGAIACGGAIAMSSTAIVVKQLQEQAEVGMAHGRRAVAVLLSQDLAVIPLLILIPAMAGTRSVPIIATLGLALVKGALVLALILVTGRWLLRPLFAAIASTRLAELFTLSVLFFTLAAAWLSHALGLSLALGAFLAGIVLADTEYRHQVEVEIRPFRDVLMGLFFATIGMLVDAGVIFQRPLWLLGAIAALIAGKAAVAAVLAWLLGADRATAVRTGLVLAQGGEFGFAVLALALGARELQPWAAQFLLAAMVVSMFASPLLIKYNRSIAQRLVGDAKPSPREALEQGTEQRGYGGHDHVIIAGFGRVGQNVARMLEAERVDYVALDLDALRVRAARRAGAPVFYGDASHPAILNAVGLGSARALVISHGDPQAALRILHQVRRQHAALPVVVRTPDDGQLDRLLAAGATEVIPETLEAALVLGTHVLLLLDVPAARIAGQVNRIRHARYRLLRDIFPGSDSGARPAPPNSAQRLHRAILQAGDYAVGRKLGTLALARCGLAVSALHREGTVLENPAASTLLQAGDALDLRGNSEALRCGARLLAQGPKGAQSEPRG